MKYLIIALSALLLLSLALGVGYRDAFEFGVQIVDGFSNSIDTIKYVFSPESFKATLYNNQNGGAYTDNNGNTIDPNQEITNILENGARQIELLYGKMWTVSMPTIIPSQYTESDFIRISIRWRHNVYDVFYSPNGFSYYGVRYEIIVARGGAQWLYRTADEYKNDVGFDNPSMKRVGFISPREQTTTLRDWFINNYQKENTT